MAGKVIVRFKKGMFDVSLISHITYYQSNDTSLVDAGRFAVDKETFLKIIYNCSHRCPDSIKEYVSLDESDQGVSYGLDDVIINNYEFEDM